MGRQLPRRGRRRESALCWGWARAGSYIVCEAGKRPQSWNPVRLMRRRALILALLAASSLALAAPARSASPKVAALQLALFQRGYYKGPFDGVAGPQTRRATKRF